jgi:energy-coupling factor transporter ATP-binding protein EcfA2
MATITSSSPEEQGEQGTTRLHKFIVRGLFGRDTCHKIAFPSQPRRDGEPDLLILMGLNGSGKTTILRMINGMIKLDFDTFRRVPFREAVLSLSTGDALIVKPNPDETLPLTVQFRDLKAALPRVQGDYSACDREPVDKFRVVAKPLLDTVNFELLDIHRSIALRQEKTWEDRGPYFVSSPSGEPRLVRRPPEANSLSERVRSFIREAQVNYRKFFVADQLELLPRILKGLSTAGKQTNKRELAAKVAEIAGRSPVFSRLGLQTDSADLESLRGLLSEDAKFNDPASLAVLEAYVEMQQNRTQTKELIANRLLGFEGIMDDFLSGKQVRVDGRRGLVIEAPSGHLNETELSSGEYHFLYMMVTALLCFRSGSIIAIDEPELSLHVTWQRLVVSALTRCASGGSPLFLFATHSSAIAAEHSDRVIMLDIG